MTSNEPDLYGQLKIDSISAITLNCSDIAASIAFYESLGFEMRYGGKSEPLTSFRVGGGYLNLIESADVCDAKNWGRVIIHVSDVDAMHARCVAGGWRPDSEPDDAVWGERYFHIRDPSGHEISFAKPID